MSAPTIHGLGPAQHRAALVVLTRAPRLGLGKSRLAATIGTSAAYLLASAFLRDSLGILASRHWAQVVSVTPANAGAEIGALVGPDTEVIAQGEGDLGERIVSALDHALLRAERAVLIGSDTPDLPPYLIETALAELDAADAVLGPAADGGFYLIAVHRTHARMFDGIEWSTSTVYERTVANLEAQGLRVTTIGEWEDVDDAESLEALARRLESPTDGRAPATRAALALLAEAAVA